MAKEIDNTAPGTHFDEAHLMMYIDGELPASEATALKAHLPACPDCRQAHSDLQEANQVFAGFHKQFSESLPAPPRSWIDFEQQLQETLAEAAPERRPWWRKLAESARKIESGALLPWTLSGAAAVLVLVFLLLHSPAKRPLSVDDVLNRAQHVRAGLDGSTALVVYQKISITDIAAPQAPVTVEIWNDQEHGRFQEQAVNWTPVDLANGAKNSSGKARQVEPPRLLRDVNAVYSANHLHLNAPVSAEVFKDWTESSVRKDESMSEEKLSGGDDAYRLSAKVVNADSNSAPNSPSIRAMELLVRAADWHAVSERLTIANQTGVHTYEIAELEYRLIPLTQLPGNVSAALEGDSSPVSDSSQDAAPGAGQLSFADLAIDVLDRLDRVDALVQDQIVVTRAGTEALQIGGIVRSDSRKAEIMAALGPLSANPAVRLTLLSAGDAQASGSKTLAHPIQMQSIEVLLNESGSVPEVRSYLANHRHVPERDLDQAADLFVTDAVEHSTEAQLHAQALKNILEIAPLLDAGMMLPATREKWCSLITRLARESGQEIHELEEQLSPVFAHASAAGGTPASGTTGEGDLRPDANRLLNMTTDSDRILWQALSTNAGSADRLGLTDAKFWLMLKEEDFLAAQIAEKARP